MVVIGLTGSIATGKSTVAGFFKQLGAYIIDWDALAREVQSPHQKAWEGIVECFGREVLNEDLTLNRQKLAAIVFKDREKLEELNRIVHPEIFREDQRVIEEIRNSDPDALVVKDIPLLGEKNSPIAELGVGRIVDKIVVIYASEEKQVMRLREKGFTTEEAMRRIESQVPIEEKIKFADFVIYNDGTIEEIRKQVENIYNELKRGSNGGK